MQLMGCGVDFVCGAVVNEKITEIVERLSKKLRRGNCWFVHDWGKWEDFVFDKPSKWSGEILRNVMGQHRYCLTCNTRQIRQV